MENTIHLGKDYFKSSWEITILFFLFLKKFYWDNAILSKISGGNHFKSVMACLIHRGFPFCKAAVFNLFTSSLKEFENIIIFPSEVFRLKFK